MEAQAGRTLGYSEEALQEAWGETLATDPQALDSWGEE